MKTAIIGAGASGIVCAINLIEGGDDVTLFEKSDRIGKKILVTGNGRCNLLNEKFCGEYFNNPDFVDKLLKKVTTEDIKTFFNSLGLLTYSDDEGRIYPITNQASSVVDVLRLKLESLNCRIILNTEINKIEKNNNNYKLFYDDSSEEYEKVVIASGNLSNNYFNNLEIEFEKNKNSLVGFKVPKNQISGLDGQRVKAKVWFNNDAQVYCESGEVQFKADGVSGICVMNLSAYSSRLNLNNFSFFIDFFEKIDEKTLKNILFSKKHNNYYLKIENIFTGLLPKNIGLLILKKLNIINIDDNIKSLTDDQIEGLCQLVKNFKVDIVGKYDNPQVVCGGVKTSQVDDNCQLKKYKNLYCIGEALNIDGLCGGFNLGFAWLSALSINKY